MKVKNYIILFAAGAMFSCTSLDIPPKNIFAESDIYGSTDGVMTQVARIYSMIPMDDFRYNYTASGLYNSNATQYKQQACLAGEAVSRDTQAADQEHNSYWDFPYKAIREANMFMEMLDKYASLHKAPDLKTWRAEAHFVRAYVYYSLVKRYGGVPLVDKAIDYPASVDLEGTKLPRNSEEEIWDFIAADLDYAIDNLPLTSMKGRANRFVAAAFKSRTMLHAGSIAKYTSPSMQYTVDGVLLCGIPAARANSYFEAAYNATKILDETSAYGLQTAAAPAPGSTSAEIAASLATNFGSIFYSNADSPVSKEHIFVRYFKKPDAVHNYDESAQPLQTKTGGNSDELCPSVDFVEMFDGLSKDNTGKLNTFDATGKYKLYESPLDFFDGCEPRLRATVILPMDQFKNQTIEIRRGIYLGSLTGGGIDPLTGVGHIGNYADLNNPDLKLDDTPISLPVTGGTMSPVGKSGIYTNYWYGSVSGFSVRKYLNPTPGITTNGNNSVQSWIEIRYAEVLLNRAEAAYELYSAGAPASSGENYLTTAFNCINSIRERAGAVLLTVDTDLNDIKIIRTERRKELAFENKTYWDLKRWRIIHEEQNGRHWRVLNPFFADVVSKYFLDVHFQERRDIYGYVFTYDTRYYYQPIPGGEITKNPNCVQNNGY